MPDYFTGYWSPGQHYQNDRKQALFFLALLAVAALISVALIVYAVLVA